MKKLLFIIFTVFTLQIQAQCWKEIAVGHYHTIAIKDNGTLWTWGNYYNTEYNMTQLGTDTNWSSISAGENCNAAIKTDGSIWTWGANDLGQLGQVTQGIADVPQMMGTDTNWAFVSITGEHAAAVKTDGTLWTWGRNFNNELGQITTEYLPYSMVPLQVGTDTDWKSTAASTGNTIAIKTNGTLWGFGGNNGIMTGVELFFSGPDSIIKTPLQIGTDTDWDYISSTGGCIFALKNNGTLWVWGNNGAGQLGNGTFTNNFVPTQLGTDTWKSVMAGKGGIKTDGSLWTWGQNSSGQLGNGTIASTNVPYMIGNDYNWESAKILSNFGGGIKADGTLYMWGFGGQGQLGNGQYNNQTPVTSPTLVNCEAFEILANNQYIQDAGFYVYPNPTSSILHLANAENLSIENITITDLSGKTVLSQKGNTPQVNVQSLPQGMYFFTVLAKEGQSNFKFIKE